MAQGTDAMGVYLVEGIVEQDPMTDRFMIQTVDQAGKPLTFDVQRALETFKGREIRVVLAPLATIEELERIVKSQQAEGANVQVGEPPQGRQIEITSAMSGGKGKMKA
jgi:hypothetical protein